jgi:hypothetical protein
MQEVKARLQKYNDRRCTYLRALGVKAFDLLFPRESA